ncbi:hypothetical protein SISNIDRAFT_485132 [Sistotremastrum niveocremeum HHB9708]|uniref:Methyltransferase n=1 Tax=Sistotremastrum niveocremeum HHB9708 TaxID=1314777 RepID=A0A164VJD0_9AGAM|nr:hypothetical protein SISNIDRAFT_485132 [Sistotremastrum niveocremeum HHB9708]
MSVAVSTTLNYFTTPTLDGLKPWSKTLPNPETGKRESNWTSQNYEVKITNVRGDEDTGLDVSGFEFFNEPTQLKDFNDEEKIKETYYAEAISIIKKHTGATRVVIFDHTIRRHDPNANGDHPSNRQPARLVHVDQSAPAAVARVHRHLPPEDVPGLLSKRFQIINLWRPISHPADESPLALCDFRSIDKGEDLVPHTLRYPDRDGETYTVKYNPNHKWKYLKGMKPDEGVLIKCFDSINDGSVAELTPHTAFIDPTTPKDAPLRQSIELRTLVFYD